MSFFSTSRAQSPVTHFNYKQILYSNWLLEVSWSNAEGSKTLRMVFRPGSLDGFGEEQFMAQTSNDNLVPLSEADHKLFASLAEIYASTKIANRDSLVQILQTVANQKNTNFESHGGSICDRRHTWTYGHYVTKYATKYVLAPIGEESSQCYGRCGAYCGFFQIYTGDCLGHDLCHRIEGSQLGVCSRQFVAAALSEGVFPSCH